MSDPFLLPLTPGASSPSPVPPRAADESLTPREADRSGEPVQGELLELRESAKSSREGRSMVRLLGGDFLGLAGRPVEVQVDVSARGTPGFHIVGLPGKSIRESRERIRTAIRNSAMRFPQTHRVLVNLAPAAEAKEGSGFDLAVAMGILLATRQIDPPEGFLDADGLARRTGFLGELGLSGELRGVPGALLIAFALRRRGVDRLIVAAACASEAALVEGLAVLPVRDLHEASAALRGAIPPFDPGERGRGESPAASASTPLDFADVFGQEATKRGLLVAAAGEHNVLLSGPPGVGKTMLARRLAGILPPLDGRESLQVTCILSASGGEGPSRLARDRPFRAPHHTVSYAGLVGGGHPIRMGEVTRAHRGVLFLDELPEFGRRSLEALREPLEEGWITVTRGSGTVGFPARFLLVGAMNPCPCGYSGHPTRACTCSPTEVRAYRQRLSGPLLDRMDLFLDVGPVPPRDLAPRHPPVGGVSSASSTVTSASSTVTSASSTVTSASSTVDLRNLVLAARKRQRARWGGGVPNSAVSLSRLLAEGDIRPEALARLQSVAERAGLSARGFARCLRVARTLADLAGSGSVDLPQVLEALQYRLRES